MVCKMKIMLNVDDIYLHIPTSFGVVIVIICHVSYYYSLKTELCRNFVLNELAFLCIKWNAMLPMLVVYLN